MGVVKSTLRRSLLNYNVERRAEKVFAKPKPTPAPMAERDAERVRLAESASEIRTAIESRDSKLDGFLTSVRVVSRGPGPAQPARPTPLLEEDPDGATGEQHQQHRLPQNRSRFVLDDRDYELRLYSPPPDSIPDGKLSMQEATALMAAFAADPRTALNASVPPRLPRDKAAGLVHYFAPFLAQKQVEVIKADDAMFWKNIESGFVTGYEHVGILADRTIETTLKSKEISEKAKGSLDPPAKTVRDKKENTRSLNSESGQSDSDDSYSNDGSDNLASKSTDQKKRSDENNKEHSSRGVSK